MHRLVRVVPVLALLLFTPIAVQTQTVKLFTLPFPGSQPWDISLGSDGNMWFTEGAFGANRLGRIDPAGRIKEFLIPSRTFTGSIAPGPDGAMWFTEPSGTSLRRADARRGAARRVDGTTTFLKGSAAR